MRKVLCFVFVCFFCLPDGFGQNRRLGLLVGINSYKNESISALKAPGNDVDGMFEVLTGPDGFGFREEDILVLKNEQATLDGIRTAIRRHLIEQADSQDLVVFYFSGHGAQICDSGERDEADGRD